MKVYILKLIFTGADCTSQVIGGVFSTMENAVNIKLALEKFYKEQKDKSFPTLENNPTTEELKKYCEDVDNYLNSYNFISTEIIEYTVDEQVWNL